MTNCCARRAPRRRFDAAASIQPPIDAVVDLSGELTWSGLARGPEPPRSSAAGEAVIVQCRFAWRRPSSRSTAALGLRPNGRVRWMCRTAGRNPDGHVEVIRAALWTRDAPSTDQPRRDSPGLVVRVLDKRAR